MSDIFPTLVGDGTFQFPVVGESHYQKQIAEIVGDWDPTIGVRNVRCFLVMQPEPDNPYDPNAVALRFKRGTVGFLARNVAAEFCAALERSALTFAVVRGVVNGGWQDPGREDGLFGIRLDARRPFTFESRPVTTEELAR